MISFKWSHLMTTTLHYQPKERRESLSILSISLSLFLLMGWWDLIVFSLRRVWTGFTTRIEVRKTGLRRLRQEVSTCEYEDVHVMWEMLSRTDTSIRRSRLPRRPARTWAVHDWTQLGFCRSF